MPNKYAIEFAPGCFDDFEGTQEELEQFVLQIMTMADTGELFTESVPVSEEEAHKIFERIKKRLTN